MLFRVHTGVVSGRGEVGQATTVEQHQGAGNAQTAQIGTIETALGAGLVADAGAVGQSADVGGDLLQQLGGGGHARFVDIGAFDGFDGQGGFALNALDAGAGDFNALQFDLLRLSLQCVNAEQHQGSLCQAVSLEACGFGVGVRCASLVVWGHRWPR